MAWLSANIAGTCTQEEIKNAERIQADREDARAEARATADAEERAQGDSRQGNGNQPAAPEGRGTEAGTRSANEGFGLTAQTNEQAAEQFAQQQEGETAEPTKEQADRERDAVPFSMQTQSQPKPQGRQVGLFTADGRVSVEAKPADLSKNPQKLDTSPEPVKETAKNEQIAQGNTAEFKDGQNRPFSDVQAFLEQYVFGKDVGALVPNPVFDVGSMSKEGVAKVARFIDGFSDKHSSVRVSGRSLKHSDEQRHNLFSAVVDQLPEIVSANDVEVLHNPNRENSAFIVHRRSASNALLIIEIAKNGNGTDVVNIISARDRQLKQHEKRSAEWLEGRRPPLILAA